MTTQEIIEVIKGLSVLELNDLVKACEEEFGVSAAACSTKNICYVCVGMFRNFGKQNRPMPNNKMKLCGLIH